MTAKVQLKKFSQFVDTLLPHETAYLLNVQQLQDPERLALLQELDIAAKLPNKAHQMPLEYDKRKYSHLKSWIEEKLNEIDVDAAFDWINHTEKEILSDNLSVADEKKIQKWMRNDASSIYYFTKFYDLLLQYRQFLLIRLRYPEHKTVHEYIVLHQNLYNKNKQVFHEIHEATQDIIAHYNHETTASNQWENRLTEVFYDIEIEGSLRYMALIRLTFIHFNYRDLKPLKAHYDLMDQWLLKGGFYSRRILLNFYSNRLLLHSAFKEYEKAMYYGYLSVKEINNDYIHYVNNLCAVMLRLQKNKEALELMRVAYPMMKLTPSFHNKIGFIAYYMRCLMNNTQFKNAENYAETFLKAYSKEVFRYRWHSFFTAYLESILQQSRYDKMLKVIQSNKLIERDRPNESSPNYQPIIKWYLSIAQYKEGLIDKKECTKLFNQFIEKVVESPDQKKLAEQLLLLLKKHLNPVIGLLDINKLMPF